jgi:ectoine hydroxylase-related dioxygenase (phytanoyl-CoA dioxygenase family)
LTLNTPGESRARVEAILARRPELDFAVELSDAQVEEFRANGFTRVDRIVPDAELVWLRELYDWLFETQAETVPGGYFDLSRPYESEGTDLQPQIIAPEARFPELRETCFFRNGRRLAARLLDVDAPALRGWGHMIRKPARIGAPLPWHQDEAYWDPAFEYTALGCWLPLDPATLETGCMRFVPGSQHEGVRKHRHVGDDPSVHALVTDDVDEARAVYAPLAAGGAIFHHCRILHSSLPNRSPHARRAYANEFQLPPVAREVAPDRPWLAEGKRAWEARRRGPAQ